MEISNTLMVGNDVGFQIAIDDPVVYDVLGSGAGVVENPR